MRVGVLAIQGGFNAHIKALSHYGHSGIEVRSESQLDHLDALILPGGESTTMLKLMSPLLENELKQFSLVKNVFATCAGLILLAEEVSHPNQRSFGTLPVSIKRNAYGRQINSFVTDNISLSKEHFSGGGLSMPGTFIRAPKITTLENGVENLATFQDEIVCVKYKNIIACSFHPELMPEESEPLYNFIFRTWSSKPVSA